MALDENIQRKLEAASAEARVVFWEDARGEFAEDAAGLEVAGAEVLVASGHALALKRRVLRGEPEGRFVIYRAGGAPALDEDFLLDIKTFAKPFSASQSSSWADDLGLPPDLAGSLAAHADFFKSKERRNALAAFVKHADWFNDGADVDGVEFAMTAVCCGSSDMHRNDAYRSIAMKLLEQWAKDDDSAMRLVERCSLCDSVWNVLCRAFGYASENPSVDDFALECMFTVCSDLTGEQPSLTPDVNVLLSSMANDKRRSVAFEALVDKTCDVVTARCNFDELPLDVLVNHRILPTVDNAIVGRVVTDVATGTDISDRIKDIRVRRSSAALAVAWLPVYDALAAASTVLSCEAKVISLVNAVESANEMYSAYIEELWSFDSAYRSFRSALNKVRVLHTDCLDELAPKVEAAYAHGLNAVAGAWQAFVVDGNQWPPTSHATRQRDFFDVHVRVAMGDGPVAVVVSDALRYECGKELAELLGADGKLAANVDAMLSELPSYTQLGMAALLPGNELSLDTGTQAVSVDGLSAKGTANRLKIICNAVAGSVALSAKKVLTDGVKSTAPLAYVYHNRIDLVGDKRDSEQDSFNAVSEALDELTHLVAELVSAGYSNVFVTADHGFLYQEDQASYECVDFALMPAVMSSDEAKHSSRFLFAPQIPIDDQLVVMDADVLGLSGSFQVAFPKGTRRFRLQGAGARFVHGGLTLQETVVPCLQVRLSKKNRAKYVGFDLLTGGVKVISGATVSFEIFQSEPIGDGVLPVALKVSLVDGRNKIVSEVVELELKSGSSQSDDRRIPVTLAVGTDVANGAVLTLKVEKRIRNTNKYSLEKETTYKIRRNFGMDF